MTPNPSVDERWEVDRLRSEGKNRVGRSRTSAGGGGINVARNLARLGHPAMAVTTAGGATGALLGELLAEESAGNEGFEFATVDIADETRRSLVLVENELEQSYHLVPAGPAMNGDECERLVAVITRTLRTDDLVVVSGSAPTGEGRSVHRRMAAAVTECDARLILDTSGDALTECIGRGAFLVKLNRREAGSLTGMEVDGFDDACSANDRIMEDGSVAIVITTLGDRGALCSVAGRHVELHSPELPGPVRSDAGAGDGLLAAVTLQLVRGASIVEACRLGVAVAAATVLTDDATLGCHEHIEMLHERVEVHER